MKGIYLCAFSCAMVLSLSLSASADDLNPAPWRTEPAGQAPTTYQAWEFSTDADPADPDVDLNPFGTAVADIEYSTPFTPWIDMDQGHQGVWYVEDYVTLTIPNNPEPNLEKLIWIQLTYYADGAGDAQFFSDPELSTVETVEKVQLDQYYWHATYLITIEPNPPIELVYLLPRDCTIYIDEIVVDTICIPEPASLALMGMGALALVRRRR